MPTLAELLEERTGLGAREAQHLHRLLGSWQLIADLSFADLLLWCSLGDEGGFVCVGQMRPYTAQTLHPQDEVGWTIRVEELPVIDRAYHEARSWQRDEPVLIDGVPVQMEAVPVVVGNGVVAVMTKEGAPLTHRRTGELEENYLECGAAFTRMVEEGSFPFMGEALDPELAPRVGDGMVRIDSEGRIIYASPNAISAFRRLGIVSNLEGELLEDAGVEAAPARFALSLGIPAEGDIEVGSSVVLQRAIPFLAGSTRQVTGALLLVRDVTELRHRERQIQRKEAVIREVHHRVKNNLQTIASLLRLQSRRSSVESKQELDEAVRRIASIAVVHEILSKDTSETVSFDEVAAQLVKMVEQGLTIPARRVTFVMEGAAGKLAADMATPLAVVLVELLQNAVEHAFTRRGGTVWVEMSRAQEGRLRMSVRDDGKGFPKGFSVEESAGLGLQIVRTLIESELGGKIRLDDAKKGSEVVLEVSTRKRSGLRP